MDAPKPGMLHWAVKKTVVVIGGGMSGLGAARELARQEMKVTLFEANSRLGGRIYTLKRGRRLIELGAEFIHGRSEPLLDLIRMAGLSTHKLPETNHILDRGKAKPLKLFAKVDALIGRVDLRKPDCSFQDFLETENVKEPLRGLAQGFAEGFDAAHAERISAHAMLRAQYSANQMEGEWQGRVNEGYGAVVRFLQRESERHGARLIMRAVVRSIRWKPGGIEVIWKQAGRARIAKADAAIVTLPLGVWQAGAVVFDPPLPEKQAIVRELRFGHVMKLIFVFRKRWWPEKIRGIIQAPAEPLPTWWDDPRGPIFTGWAGGPRAEAISSLSVKRLERLGVETLSRMFSQSAQFLRKQLLSVQVHNWTQDPHIRGSYSYIPVNGLDLPGALAAPVADTLFFAGEATVTDAQTGTVFGAYETGLRAAREVLSCGENPQSAACSRK